MASVDGSWYSPLRPRGRENAPSPLPRLGGSGWRALCLVRAGVGPHAHFAPPPSACLLLFLLCLLHLRLLFPGTSALTCARTASSKQPGLRRFQNPTVPRSSSVSAATTPYSPDGSVRRAASRLADSLALNSVRCLMVSSLPAAPPSHFSSYRQASPDPRSLALRRATLHHDRCSPIVLVHESHFSALAALTRRLCPPAPLSSPRPVIHITDTLPTNKRTYQIALAHLARARAPGVGVVSGTVTAPHEHLRPRADRSQLGNSSL
ncbi:hypothetical protein K466DRAFT_583508 [Polyporus arcularius HHB13444]|uniref:Uncharacterized protein n=1 Tax=Polyporus arcularius HHB13444 TaxID=1314778 RepID=A0A5C3PNN6_9APHY|nr:hypothetical protein K466DRAFT_583508 [Polyporus arcularius HHB13444]